MVDKDTEGLVDLLRRLDAGQIVTTLDESSELPPLLWEARDYLAACDTKLREQNNGTPGRQ